MTVAGAYNHHHVTSIVGKNTEMVEMNKAEAEAKGIRGHLLSGGKNVWAPVATKASASGLPTHALFDDGNGGEYRKTFHGYAAPFAQIVESPKQVAGTAMQIDTWNRAEMKLPSKPGDKPPKFVPGPHPRGSLAPTEGPDAIYSGLLECPLTSRVQVLPNNDSLDFGVGMAPFGQGSGYYNYTGDCRIPTSVPGGQNTDKCHQWGQINANRCPGQPRGDLLAQRNPSCDIRTYVGGLATCLHGWHLLDADQEVRPSTGTQALSLATLAFCFIVKSGCHGRLRARCRGQISRSSTTRNSVFVSTILYLVAVARTLLALTRLTAGRLSGIQRQQA